MLVSGRVFWGVAKKKNVCNCITGASWHFTAIPSKSLREFSEFSGMMNERFRLLSPHASPPPRSFLFLCFRISHPTFEPRKLGADSLLQLEALGLSHHNSLQFFFRFFCWLRNLSHVPKLMITVTVNINRISRFNLDLKSVRSLFCGKGPEFPFKKKTERITWMMKCGEFVTQKQTGAFS